MLVAYALPHIYGELSLLIGLAVAAASGVAGLRNMELLPNAPDKLH